MSVKRISRRQFLSLSAMSGGGLLLAACGASAPATATPAPVAAPTSSPAAASSGSGAAGGLEEIKVMVGDVLDFALESDQWTGQFGYVTFKLNEGRFNGQPIYYIRTDASDIAFAEENELVFVPLLNAGLNVAATLYVFADERPPVFSTAPSEEDFTSLFRMIQVTVNDASLTLDSAEAVETAVGNGAAATEEMNVFVNYPVVKWPGGELPADPDKTESLGKGPLIEPVDVDNMTATFKLHQCFPGSRYIITDTSTPEMAPMMSIAASPPNQALMDSGATDEIWVFANGIPGSGVMGFQPAIFDNEAGQPAWSPFWNHFTLKWNDESQARVLRSSAEIRAALEAGELEQFNGVPDSHPNGFVVNCPAPILAPNTFGL